MQLLILFLFLGVAKKVATYIEKEIFAIQVQYDGVTVPVEIRIQVSQGPAPGRYYEIWIYESHHFTMDPHLEVCDEPCWQPKEPYKELIDKELISKIGMEIERHYL